MIPETRYVILSITFAMLASGASEKPFHAGTATDYSHQESEQVLIGAKPFNTEALTAEAFGKKADLLRHQVLPVLVVIQNNRKRTVDLRNVEVNLVGADGRHVQPVPPEDLPYLASHTKPPKVPGTGFPPIPLPKKKNPLNDPELVERAFAAKVLPPGDSASGFFYFEAVSEPGDRLYVNGLRDTPSGQEILYFEFEIKDK